ncbi:MAG: ATP-binding protein [Isosphaeraceae bacterium]
MDPRIRIPRQFRIIAVLAAIMVILGVLTVLTLTTTNRMIHDRDWIAHTQGTLAELQEARALIDDAEAQQRGFLLSGDMSLPPRFERSLHGFMSKLDTLRLLLAGEPGQIDRLDRIAVAARTKFTAMRSVIDTRRTEGAHEARSQVSSEIRDRAKRDPRAILFQMITVERKLLEDRVERARVSDVRAAILFSLLLLAFLACLSAFFWMIWKSLKHQAESAYQLRKSREQYELAVRGSNDGIWDWDIESDTVYFSPRWKSQLGYEDHEITHQFFEFENRLHPDDHDRVMNTVQEYLKGRLRGFSVEFRMRCKDGSYRWILARGLALRDEHGEPFRMAGSHTDITERKEVESKLAEQNQLLERAMKAERETNLALRRAQALMVQNEKMAGLGQMVAGVAHEINNPLAFITSNVAMLQRDFAELVQLVRLHESAWPAVSRDAPDVAHQIGEFRQLTEMDETLKTLPDLLTRTAEGLKRIRRIVGDLRLFARLDEGEVNEADLNKGIESTATIILGHARTRDVQLNLDLEPLPPVTCHAARVNQVVMNLLSNAIDACDPGGTVTVRTENENGHVRIDVIDNGHGITPAIRDRIFDPFFTTKPIGKGTGLGLSISYGIIQDHGGTIEVDSTPGQGSRFTVRLPLRPATPREEEAE